MPVSMDMDVDTRAIEKALKKAPAVMAEELRKGFEEILLRFERDMTMKRLRGRPGLMVRTGALRRSQKRKVTGRTLKTLKGTYGIGGPTAPYAGTHEFGATIVARNAPYLVFQIAPAGGGLARTGIWRRAKRVTIQPRLGMRALWKKSGATRRAILKKRLRRGIERATK